MSQHIDQATFPEELPTSSNGELQVYFRDVFYSIDLQVASGSVSCRATDIETLSHFVPRDPTPMSANDGNTLLWERHESLYFADGNVVLRAPLPGKLGSLFRVHKSVLSSHSPVFSDMFYVCSEPGNISKTEADGVSSEAQVDNASDTEAGCFYDGVPLVDIPDDGNHLESVLKILYYQSTLPWTPRSPHYPDLITPTLDLSRKYGIDRIHDQIKGHLESDWPQTLKDWDKLEKDIEFMAKDPDLGLIDDHFPEPAAAIKLARQFDIPNILPAAFYHLSRLSILDDWDKTHTVPFVSTSTQNRTRRTARWRLLSAQDFRCLLLAKAEFAEIMRGWTDLGKHKLKPRSTRLPDGEDCKVREKLWKDIRDRLQSTDPLALLNSGSTVDVCCQTCANELRDKLPAVRGKIWETLGELCRLE